MFLKERVTASERYQWTTAFERKCAADIFLCEADSRNISMFIIERAAASKKISMSDCFWNLLQEKMCFLEIMST